MSTPDFFRARLGEMIDLVLSAAADHHGNGGIR